MKEFPLLSMFNIHENLLESLLELQNYADVQAVLAKYDGETHTERQNHPDLFLHKHLWFTRSTLSVHGVRCDNIPIWGCNGSQKSQLGLYHGFGSLFIRQKGK